MVDFFFSSTKKNPNRAKKGGKGGEQRLQMKKKGNKCVLLGLRVGKLFLDSIIFFSDFFRLARRTQLALLFRLPPSPNFPCRRRYQSLSMGFFYVFFFLFQFPLEWKSLEHYCNFFPPSKNLLRVHSSPSSRSYNSHLYKMDGFFCASFFSVSLRRRRWGCGKLLLSMEFIGSDLCVCVCSLGGLWKWRGLRNANPKDSKREKKSGEIMLPGLNNRVICHFSPFKYDDTIIMSILFASLALYSASVRWYEKKKCGGGKKGKKRK